MRYKRSYNFHNFHEMKHLFIGTERRPLDNLIKFTFFSFFFFLIDSMFVTIDIVRCICTGNNSQDLINDCPKNFYYDQDDC